MRFLAALFALLIAAPASAAVVYQYTGALFDSKEYLNGGPIPQVGELQIDRLTATLTVEQALAPSTSYASLPWDYTVTVPDYGLDTDTRGTITELFICCYDIRTDAAGQIVEWAFSGMVGATANDAYIDTNNFGDRIYSDSEYSYFDASNPEGCHNGWCDAGERLNYRSSQAGQWSRVTPVPLPASGLLLLGGLALMLSAKRRARSR